MQNTDKYVRIVHCGICNRKNLRTLEELDLSDQDKFVCNGCLSNSEIEYNNISTIDIEFEEWLHIKILTERLSRF